VHRGFILAAGVVALAFEPVASAAEIAIDHAEVGCIVAGKHPRIFARFEPADQVVRARLHFRAAGSTHWHSVPMSPEGFNFWAVLPKPESRLKKMEYYISATDGGAGESRTPELMSDVATGPGGCPKGKLVAIALDGSRPIVVHPPGGQAVAPEIPRGFSSDNVVVGTRSPSTPPKTSASGRSAPSPGTARVGSADRAKPLDVPVKEREPKGGGIGAKTLVIGGLVAGAATAGVIVAKRSASSDGPTTLTGTWQATGAGGSATYDLTQNGSALTGQLVSTTAAPLQGNTPLTCTGVMDVLTVSLDCVTTKSSSYATYGIRSCAGGEPSRLLVGQTLVLTADATMATLTGAECSRCTLQCSAVTLSRQR